MLPGAAILLVLKVAVITGSLRAGASGGVLATWDGAPACDTACAWCDTTALAETGRALAETGRALATAPRSSCE